MIDPVVKEGKILIPSIDITKNRNGNFCGLCDEYMNPATKDTRKLNVTEAINQLWKHKRMVLWIEGELILKIRNHTLLAWAERFECWMSTKVDLGTFVDGTFLCVKEELVDISKYSSVADSGETEPITEEKTI
jgi:hypothetical protein